MTLPTLTLDERTRVGAAMLDLSRYAVALRRHAQDAPDEHGPAIAWALAVEAAAAILGAVGAMLRDDDLLDAKAIAAAQPEADPPATDGERLA